MHNIEENGALNSTNSFKHPCWSPEKNKKYIYIGWKKNKKVQKKEN